MMIVTEDYTRAQLGDILDELGLLALPAVEVGIAEGSFSINILRWGVPLLYLVDLWRHVPGGYAAVGGKSDEEHAERHNITLNRLSEYVGRYRVLQGWSHEVCREIPDNSLGFCFIDASHDYENVRRDLGCYWPKLVPSGLMAGHDWPIHGVQKAVGEFARDRGMTIHILPVNKNDASWWLESNES